MTWLIVIFSLGLLIVILESKLEAIVVWLESRGIIKTPTAEWFSNDTLQLQRMAHEELGLGDWDGCTGPGVIPITKKGQLLGTLDNDPKHPRLVNPATLPNGPNAGKVTDSTIEAAPTEGSETEANGSADFSQASHGDISGNDLQAQHSTSQSSVASPHADSVEFRAVTQLQSPQVSPVERYDRDAEQSPELGSPGQQRASLPEPDIERLA